MLNHIRATIFKAILCLMMRREDLVLLHSLLSKELLSEEQGAQYLLNYRKLYRSNRLQMLTDLARESGYGTSISDIARFCREHDHANA